VHVPGDDEVLEPLPVDVDGVEVAPVRADPEIRLADIVPRPHEIVDAVKAALSETADGREGSAWSMLSPPAAPVKSATFLAAFTRMTTVHPAQLDGLEEWWKARARDDRVEIAHRLVLEEPHRDTGGTWRVRGRLRSPWRARSIPVEVLLWPRLGSWTKLTVEPQRGVHVSRRYFRSGHRVLDVLTDLLRRELRVGSHV
jgi:hypothetical protein